LPLNWVETQTSPARGTCTTFKVRIPLFCGHPLSVAVVSVYFQLKSGMLLEFDDLLTTGSTPQKPLYSFPAKHLNTFCEKYSGS